MSALHVHVVTTHVHAQHSDGERWCFYCRKRVEFTITVHVPDDPLSYYGPHATVTCPSGHADGDLFPGLAREWE